MREHFFSWLTGISLLFLLPCLLTMLINGPELALLRHSPEVEDWLTVIVSEQISKEYNLETLKAQAVIARTNLYRRISQKESIKEIMTSLCGTFTLEDWLWKFPDPVYEQAVSETDGQILSYEGELKLVPYHEVSGGTTRSGQEVFHDEAYAYLVSVDSSADKNAEDYLTSTYYAVGQMPKSLKILERDSAGYVTALAAEDNILEGEAFRQGMRLVSADFSIQKLGDQYRFLCKGKGHGLGFSQYGGNMLAKAGYSWEEILEYYFPLMETEDINEVL